MADANPKVAVRGLRELRGALKQIDNELPGKLKEGFREIAETVASKARSKVPFQSGDARSSIKARGSQRGASIAFGGSKAPYMPWLDFGGSTGRGHVPGKSFSGAIIRPFEKDGRYIYPTIKEENRNISDSVDDLLADLIVDAGFETRE